MTPTDEPLDALALADQVGEEGAEGLQLRGSRPSNILLAGSAHPLLRKE
jgi:hypothetical protein